MIETKHLPCYSAFEQDTDSVPAPGFMLTLTLDLYVQSMGQIVGSLEISVDCRTIIVVITYVYLGTSEPTVRVHGPITGERCEDVRDPDSG